MNDKLALTSLELAAVAGGFALLDRATASVRSVAHNTIHGAFNWGAAAIAGWQMSDQLFGSANTWSRRVALIEGIHKGLASADELPRATPAWLRTV